METTVTVERVDEDTEFLPSHEILRENLKKTRKRAKLFTEYKCRECGKVLSDKASLANHIQTHSTACPFQCRQCPYKGKTRKYLLRHMSRAHREPSTLVSCKYCDKTFRFKSKMLVHERVHTGEKPNKCDVCGKAFSSAYSLASHKFIHTDEKPFKCSFCEYSCRDSSTLRKHEERHMGIKRYKCDYCEKRFDVKYRLECHTKEIHTAPEARNHACDKCASTFRNKWALQRHTALVHDRIKSCNCSVCGVYIPNSYNLAMHMRTHVDAKPFVCTFDGCNRCYKTKSDLKKHTLIHYPHKHVTCDHCGKTFARKSRLAKHIRKLHDAPNTKSERCHFCGVCFLTKNYLSKHINTKHVRNKTKYICDMCDFATHNKPSIVMHIKHGHDNTKKTKCTICGKIYKRNVNLKLHYKNSHNVRFKTKSRTMPKIQIKEEPIDPVLDLEIDLLDIDKEEPFTGFETEYSEDVSKMASYASDEKEQRLHELFKNMIHDPEYDVKDPIVPDPITDSTKLENRTEDTPQSSQMPLEDLVQQDTLLLVVGDEATPGVDDITESTDNPIEASQSEESPNNKTKAEDQPVALIEPKNTTESETGTGDIARNTPMPVEEFIQQVVGDVDNPAPNEEFCGINKESEDFLKRRVKELIMNQRLADQIRRRDYGRRVLERVAQDEAKIAKTVTRKPTVPQTKSNTKTNKVNIERKNKERKVTKKKNKTRKRYKKNVNNKTDVTRGEERERESNTKKRDSGNNAKLIFNSFECNVCYKLFETKPQLLEHCQIHFDVCSESTLCKCPLCHFVADKDIKKHFRTVHKEDISISFMRILDRKQNDSGSRYYYNTENEKAKEIEIIPSVKILNKKAGMELDRRNREKNNKLMSTTKLVKKGKEWVVEKQKFDLSGYVLPNTKELDKNDVDYLSKLKKLGIEAKIKGVKMLYPCNKCEKVCQNLSALTLHSRKHDPDKKPFAPKVWRHKMKDAVNNNSVKEKNDSIVIKNRTAKPKPIVNKHKCDPKLKEFYKNNIRGLNIEFWQFLKIYNKMDRENVKDFDDLKNSTEYGLGHVNYLEETQVDNVTNIDVNNQITDINKDNSKSKINATPMRNNKKSVCVASRKNNHVANVKNKFTRTIKISREEYNKRKQLKMKLREKIANSGNE